MVTGHRSDIKTLVGSRDREGDGKGLVKGDKVWAFLSFASMCFSFPFFYCLIQETLIVLQNRSKRLLHFEIAGVKSQSLKRRGKITIML